MLLGDELMISRAGKFTEEIHMILKHKEEILSGQPKKQLFKSQSNFRIESLQDRVSLIPWRI